MVVLKNQENIIRVQVNMLIKDQAEYIMQVLEYFMIL